MKKDRNIYWVSTGAVTLIMLFSFYKMYTPEYAHLGFPNYFRTEMMVLKALGLAALLVPQIPLRVKDWAYAGFAIVLISASVAHFNSGDSVWLAINPWFYLIMLGVSNYYMYRRKAAEGYY